MKQLSLFKVDRVLVKPAEYSVTKANTLIEANYRLSLTQQRIVLLLASLVQPDDKDFKTYRIYVKDLMDILDINRSHLYEQMIVMIRNLMKIVVTINLGDGKYLDTHWIDGQKYEIGGGYSDITFHPELKPFFLCLKERFTTYKLENVMRLKSIYSIRIYELLKQYQSIGKRTITIENLRKMLGILPKEYKTYNNLKRKVIEVAHKEINEKTDISFEFREIKHIRRVVELEFTIAKKEAPSRQVSPEEKAEVRRKKKVETYLKQLTPGELAELTKEAEDRARKECPALYRDREIQEPVLRGYMCELAGSRVKKRKK